jgi:hypothetical protein
MRYKLDKKKRMLVRHPFQHVCRGISSHFLTFYEDMGTEPDFRLPVPSFAFRENKKPYAVNTNLF